jgi:hypothetical protein
VARGATIYSCLQLSNARGRSLMKIASLLATLLLTYSGSSFAGPHLWSGKQLLQYYQTYESVTANRERSRNLASFGLYLGYIRGTYESLAGSPEKIMCVDSSVAIEQIARVIGDYMLENPQQLNLPAVYLVRKSLHDAFPCR